MKEDEARIGAGANPRVLGRLLIGAQPDPGLDWQATVELARQHRVSPLLFWRLVQRSKEAGGQAGREEWAAIPREVKESLRDDFGTAAARANRAERQLAEVVGALAATGVPAMVVKGAAVAAFYPDPALRSYSDLDVLVPRAQVEQAETALNSLGYRCTQPKDWSLAHHYHLPPMVRDRSQLAVEVHWRLDDTRRIGYLPVDDLWFRAVPWSVEGQPVQRLEAVDAVLYLCYHAMVQDQAHMRLSAPCDLVQVMDGWGLAEWETLARRAANYGLRRVVYLMLVAMQQALGQVVPGEVVAALRPSDSGLMPDDLAEWLFGQEHKLATRAAVAFVPVGVRKKRLGRPRRFLRSLFLPRYWMSIVYHVPTDSPRIWLTYLRRPVDLLRRYRRTAWDALRGKRAVRAAWEREVWLERWLGQEAVENPLESAK